MRLFFAGSAGSSAKQEQGDSERGVENRLITYAEIDEQVLRNRWQPHSKQVAEFWIDARQAALVRLYSAGSVGGSGGKIEHELYAAGCRHRLATYYDLDPQARTDGAGGPRGNLLEPFWIDATPAERAEQMKVFLAGTGDGGDNGKMLEVAAAAQGAHRLVSYANVLDGTGSGEFLIDMRRRLAELGGDFQSLWRAATRDERLQLMRVFLAGNVKGSGETVPDADDHAAGVENRLLTFADIDGWAEDSFAFWMAKHAGQAFVFLDSGAFGAMSRGAVIDIDRYCDYIKAHQSALSCYAALDVIGDWQATAKNVDYMLAKGLQPIPTFHAGSPWHELDRLAGSFPFIALGGLAGTGKSVTQEGRQPYLDEAWSHIEKFWPVKVHIFGYIAQWALERYPFYSADSSTAIMGAGMGRVMAFRDGVLRSEGWVDHLRRTWDGVVADGVGRTEGKSKSAHAGRRRRNIEALLAYERHVTDLWTARGVTWSA